MTQKVYDLPEGFTVPRWDFSKPYSEQKAKEDAFIADLKAWCITRNPNQKYVGETISFPVADGKAVYMVAAMTPLQLIHLPIGDAWTFQYEHLLTKKEVIQKINTQNKLAELFGRKQI